MHVRYSNESQAQDPIDVSRDVSGLQAEDHRLLEYTSPEGSRLLCRHQLTSPDWTSLEVDSKV